MKLCTLGVLQYDEIALTFTVWYGVCSHCSVCEVVLVPCVVGVVFALTGDCVLLFVCDVSLLKGCEGTEILVWGWGR